MPQTWQVLETCHPQGTSIAGILKDLLKECFSCMFQCQKALESVFVDFVVNMDSGFSAIHFLSFFICSIEISSL